MASLAACPADHSVDPKIASFFEQFYSISDTPDAHEMYAEQFTEDATLVMASKTARGMEGTRFALAVVKVMSQTQAICNNRVQVEIGTDCSI